MYEIPYPIYDYVFSPQEAFHLIVEIITQKSTDRVFLCEEDGDLTSRTSNHIHRAFSIVCDI